METASTPAKSHVAVADIIRRWVALGVLGPGDRLPTERELAEQLHVGRMTARQAVRLLGSEGLVETQRGRSGGTFVLDDADRPARRIAVTEAMLDAVRDNFEFRRALEPTAAALAARHATRDERGRIRELAEGDATSIGVFRMLDSRFHLAIAEAGANDLFLQAISQSRAEFFMWADAAWERVDWSAVPPGERDFGAHHRPVAQAIADGDPEHAQTEMFQHLVEGQEQFFDVIKYSR